MTKEHDQEYLLQIRSDELITDIKQIQAKILSTRGYKLTIAQVVKHVMHEYKRHNNICP